MKFRLSTIIFTTIIFFYVSSTLYGQKFFTREGKITLISETPVERIEALNKTAVSVIDFTTGAMEFAALIKAFYFEKAILQEYFNEHFLQSNQYPKAVFKGKITNIESVDLQKMGVYPVTVEGDLTAHGQTKKVKTNGKLMVKDEMVGAKASFFLSAEEYKIPIPEVVRENLAKQIQIDIDVNLKSQ